MAHYLKQLLATMIPVLLTWSSEFQLHIIMVLSLARPGMMDFKGKAKWDAWTGKKGMTKEAAKEAYVAKAEGLVAKLGTK